MGAVPNSGRDENGEFPYGAHPDYPRDESAPVRLIGPFQEHRVVVYGRQVPFLTAHEVDGGSINLIFDKRLIVLLPAGMFDDVAAFVAGVIEQCFDPTLGKQFPVAKEVASVGTA